MNEIDVWSCSSVRRMFWLFVPQRRRKTKPMRANTDGSMYPGRKEVIGSIRALACSAQD